MSMHAAGWTLGRDRRSARLGAATALVIAVVALGAWEATRGGGSGSTVVVRPAPARVALVFAKPVSSPSLPFARGPEAIYRATPTGGDPVQLARGADPAISPDGRWVVYRRDSGHRPDRLFVISSAGGTPRRLAASSYDPVAWSWDSRSVAVADSAGVEIVDVRSAKTTNLPLPPASGDFSFSPDGSELAFAHRIGEGQDVYTVSTRGGAVHRLTDDGDSTSPLWGPGGIAFERAGDVWLMNADGSDTHQLTHTHAGIYPAAWSADGSRMLAAYPPTNNGKLYAVDVTTGDARDLTGYVGDLYAQGISRDGKTILAAVGCGESTSPFGTVKTIPFAGGHPTVIANGPCRASWNA